MKKLEKKAKREAEIHTIFMALADLNKKINPNSDYGEYLNMLQSNVEAEKNRIINSAIQNNNA